MKSLKFIRGAIVALAAVGVVFPQLPAIAAGPRSAPPVKMLAAGTILDVGLAQGGTFTGRVVDHTGAAMEGAQVVIKQGKTEVTRTVTDKQGTFVASNLKGGVYTVASGATEGVYRVWSESTAPPSAKGQALLVLGQNGARGQSGLFNGDLNTVLLVTTLVVASGALLFAVKAHEDTHEILGSPGVITP